MKPAVWAALLLCACTSNFGDREHQFLFGNDGDRVAVIVNTQSANISWINFKPVQRCLAFVLSVLSAANFVLSRFRRLVLIFVNPLYLIFVNPL
ncbi:hypothetical protein EZZ76_03630 [Neisseria meningitidis]|nr:hypothetical protein [Neisseria meningitidis]